MYGSGFKCCLGLLLGVGCPGVRLRVLKLSKGFRYGLEVLTACVQGTTQPAVGKNGLSVTGTPNPEP